MEDITRSEEELVADEAVDTVQPDEEAVVEEEEVTPTQRVRRPVKYYPDPILEKRSVPVIDPRDPLIQQLIEDLKETMLVGGGLGLAAPQIGSLRCVFVTRMDCDNIEDGLDQEVKVYVNPVVTLGGKNKVKTEGCMSFPGVLIRTKRATKVTVTALDAHGIKFTEELSGLQAHVVQHEANHLDGITLFQRMDETQRIKTRKNLKTLRKFLPYHKQMEAKATTLPVEACDDECVHTEGEGGGAPACTD